MLCACPVSVAQIAGDLDQSSFGAVPETEPEIVNEWIGQLDNPDWLMRDLATLELGELDPGISLETLEAYVHSNELSAEQQARLWLACLRRYSARSKGALGVSFGTIRVGAIEVQPIPPDDKFPATKVLREGDQIAMVGDRVIDGSFALRVEILSREPGELLPVTILRAERIIHIDLPLGSFDNLTGAVRMDSDLLTKAMSLRWERLGLKFPPRGTVGDGLDINDWRRAAFPENTTPDARETDLRAPRGWVLGPGMPTDIENGRWTRASMGVWTDPGNLRESLMRRGQLLGAEHVQPYIALRMLIEREREQIKVEIEKINDETARKQLTEQLNDLTLRLDTLTREIERTQTLITVP